MSTEGSTKAVVAALLANTGIAVTKFLAFLLTGASSMLAEAIHSVADSGNQGLLLLGGRQARKRPTAEHPFGYGRERYIYAFIVSIVLFSVGGLFALYEAYHKGHELHATHGHPDDSLLDSRWWWVPIVVLLAAIVMEWLSFRTAIRETGHVKGDASYVEFVRRAKQPELPVILLEDFAALCGLVFALLGVGLSLLTHNLWFDVVGTALIGLLLVAVAVVLGIETKSLLLGESASVAAEDRIADALAAPTASTGSSTSRPCTSAPTSCSSPPRSPCHRDADARTEIADRHRRAPRPRSGPSSRSPRVIYLEPDI